MALPISFWITIVKIDTIPIIINRGTRPSLKVGSLDLLLDSQAAVYIIVPNLKNSTG